MMMLTALHRNTSTEQGWDSSHHTTASVDVPIHGCALKDRENEQNAQRHPRFLTVESNSPSEWNNTEW